MQVVESSIRSEILGNERRLWLQRPAGGRPPQAIVVLLDGEYYERMSASAVIEELQTEGVIPATGVVFVSHLDGAVRWPESFCNERFAWFLRDELVPWARKLFADATPSAGMFLGGLSLTGLAAAHAALVCGKTFAGVLCQSASFWWSDCWLVEQVLRGTYPPQRFRITCGTRETQDYVEHGPELTQRTSQLAANRAMRDALLAQGHSVSYHEFDGGHDLASWKADLAESLPAILR